MRRQRRRIFVGCEGEGERSYIALVQRIVDGVHQQVHLDAHPLQPGGGDPLDLARRAEEVIKKIERTREPYGEKYLLIDRDTLGNSPQRDREMRAKTTSTRGSSGRTPPTRLSSCDISPVVQRVDRRAPRSRCASFDSNGPNMRSRCRRCNLRAASVSKGCVRPRGWRTTFASCLPLSSCSSAARLSAQARPQGCEAGLGTGSFATTVTI